MGAIMRRLFSISIAVMMLTIVATVAMAGPPTQLYGKSILYRWMEDIDEKLVDGYTKHVVVNQAIGLYLSSRGRLFTQSSRSIVLPRAMAPAVASGWSRDPEGHEISNKAAHSRSVFQFQGRTLTVNTQYMSGARRVTVSFDENFRTCNIDVVYGKEGGVPGVVARGLSGTTLLIMQVIKVSGQNCTITDGNMFGGNSE
jgi:hypothetical protein